MPWAYAIATAIAFQDLYNTSTSGTPVLSDPLRDNNNGNLWSEGSDNISGCTFTGGAYLVSESTNGSTENCRGGPNFSNFAYQVQMRIIKGDGGGVSFRNTGST